MMANQIRDIKFGSLFMGCHFCGREEPGLPFRCNYCGESFCSEHRLPENHACPRVGGPIQPGYAKVRGARSFRERPVQPYVKAGRSRFRLRYANLFSRTERRHILIATAVMILVGLSLVFPLFLNSPEFLVLLVPAFALSFLGHELAHKFVAQRNGLWTEFRTTVYGLMLTAVSVILPFKFLAPGQSVIQGSGSREINGAIALVGPGFNIALGTLFFILAKVTGGLLSFSFLSLTLFNAWIALFNLIPFGSLDGTLVYQWDKTRLIIALVGSIVLLVLSFRPGLI